MIADEIKYFSLDRACIKVSVVLTFFIVGFVFYHIFGRGISSVICDLVLYLQIEGLNIS